jgi:hypothetical protein
VNERCCLRRQCREVIRKTAGAIKSVLYGSLKKSDRREPPFREDLSSEGEESPLLEAVTRERLVKTQQAGKGLVEAVVICEMWRLAVEL